MSINLLLRRLPAAGVLSVALLVALFGLDAAPPALGVVGGATLDTEPAARVTLTVRLGAAGKGTFRMTGAFTDSGSVVAKRSVARGRLRMTQTMTGANGTLVISSSHACTRSSGTWSAVSGTRTYASASGGGVVVNGRIRCLRPWKPSTAVYTGALTVPPPALATPGTYAGFTPQDQGIAFEVAPSGRAVVNLVVDGYTYECVSESGFRQSLSKIDQTAGGPFPIANDGTFVVQLGPVARFSGDFTASGATGAISVEHPSTDPYRQPSKCAGQIPWTVTTPPPPPRRALPGTYCGFTRSDHGVCLDVPEGGREFRNLRVGAILRCDAGVSFLLEFTADIVVPFRANLTFEHRFMQPIPGGDPVSVSLRGSFDQAGAATGAVVLARSSFIYQGTRYTCSGGGATWTVKLQR